MTMFASAAMQCAQMTEDSHAWGGVHSAHWQADQLAPGSVTVNGNTYQASAAASDGVGQPGFGNVDKYSYQSAQKWIYVFRLLKAAEEDPMAEAGFSGLYVKLSFPVPIVATAVYGGYGAVDVTPKPPSYAYRGSTELVLRLCSGGNRYNGVCPRYIVTEGAHAEKLGTLEIHGERRGPLEDSEEPSSIMAVGVECEGNSEYFERTVASSGGTSPPAPSPSPSAAAAGKHKRTHHPPPSSAASETYDSDRDERREGGLYYDQYTDEDDEEEKAEDIADAIAEDAGSSGASSGLGLRLGTAGSLLDRRGWGATPLATAQREQRPASASSLMGSREHNLGGGGGEATTGVTDRDESIDSLLSSWVAHAHPAPPSRLEGLDELLGFGAFRPPPPPHSPPPAPSFGIQLASLVRKFFRGEGVGPILLVATAGAVLLALVRLLQDTLRACGCSGQQPATRGLDSWMGSAQTSDRPKQSRRRAGGFMAVTASEGGCDHFMNGGDDEDEDGEASNGDSFDEEEPSSSDGEAQRIERGGGHRKISCWGAAAYAHGGGTSSRSGRSSRGRGKSDGRPSAGGPGDLGLGTRSSRWASRSGDPRDSRRSVKEDSSPTGETYGRDDDLD